MRRASLVQAAFGLSAGGIASFVVGCGYAYAVWRPPSNDWGNEKTWDTLLLVPVSLIVFVAAIFLRKRLRRLILLSATLGRVGLIAAIVGATILPSINVLTLFAEQRAIAQQRSNDAAEGLKRLAEMGAQIKAAHTVVVDSIFFVSAVKEFWFIARLSQFMGRPVLVVRAMPNGPRTESIWEYQFAPPNLCRSSEFSAAERHYVPVSAEICLIGTVSPGADGGSGGLLLSITLDGSMAMVGQTSGTSTKSGRSDFYPQITTRSLNGPYIPTANHTLSGDSGASASMSWRNPCADRQQFGPFPFGRGVRLQQCPELLDFKDVADRMLGPAPSILVP